MILRQHALQSLLLLLAEVIGKVWVNEVAILLNFVITTTSMPQVGVGYEENMSEVVSHWAGMAGCFPSSVDQRHAHLLPYYGLLCVECLFGALATWVDSITTQRCQSGNDPPNSI